MKKSRSSKPARSYWLWVTKGEYYQDPDGGDRDILEPGDAEIYWSCHKDTRRGDLVLLWRTTPKCDVAYLLQVTEDATATSKAGRWHWPYGCAATPLFKFNRPLTVAEIRSDPMLSDWSAKGHFQKKAWKIEPKTWARLCRRLEKTNADFKKVLASVRGRLAVRILREERLEQRLADHPRLFRKILGFDVEVKGRQLYCDEQGTYIDLLLRGRHKRRFVVVELKVVRATRNHFGQIAGYMGWVRRHLAGGAPVRAWLWQTVRTRPSKTVVWQCRF